MKEFAQIIKVLGQLGEQGKTCALATVVNISGSTYRGHGARMLMTPEGQTVGTISGGCLEGDVFERARQVMATGAPAYVKYDTTSEDDIYWGTGMGCGGVTEVFIDKIEPPSPLLRIPRLLEEKSAVALVTVYRTASPVAALPGRHLIFDGEAVLHDDFAGTPFSEALVSIVRRVLAERKSSAAEVHTDAGRVFALVEYLAAPPPLLIFGGGHDVAPVVNLANQLGWHTTVVEYREPLALPERFPLADAVLLWDGETHTPPLPLTARAACVVMTHHYLTDKKILQEVLPSPVRYIGFLGPKKRCIQLLDELRREGQEFSAAQLARLYSPVGLDIGAETPEEVALSMISEIQAVISGRRGGMLRDRKGAIHER